MGNYWCFTYQGDCYNTVISEANYVVICGAYEACALSTIDSSYGTWNYGAGSSYQTVSSTERNFNENYGYGSSAFSGVNQVNLTSKNFGEASFLGATSVSLLWADSEDPTVGIFCSGTESCAHTQLTTLTQIDSTGGLFSLFNSTVSTPVSGVTLSLTGYYAGFSSSWTCLPNEYCQLTCRGNACFNFDFNCDVSVSSCFLSCDHTNVDTSCPNGWFENSISSSESVSLLPNYAFLTELEQLIGLTYYHLIPTYANVIKAQKVRFNTNDLSCQVSCYDTSGCLGAGAVYESTAVAWGAGPSGAVCCFGYNSCAFATILVQGENVLCEGYEACAESSVSARNVFFGGYSAGRITTVSFIHFMSCGASSACNAAIISDGEILLCTGESSCSNSRISNVSDIFGFGYKSLQNSQISAGQDQTKLNIFFLGVESADSVDIKCDLSPSCIINIYCENDSCDTVSFVSLALTCNINLYETATLDAVRPSSEPTNAPSNAPINAPTIAPTGAPTLQPTDPTNAPTFTPSVAPSSAPSDAPTSQPSDAPSVAPSLAPTTVPSGAPILAPTSRPTLEPSLQPSDLPSETPTSQPTLEPSVEPTLRPVVTQTVQTTVEPESGGADGATSKDNGEEGTMGSNMMYIILIVGTGVFCCCAALFIFSLFQRKRLRQHEKFLLQHDKNGGVEMQVSVEPIKVGNMPNVQAIRSLSPTASQMSFDASFGDTGHMGHMGHTGQTAPGDAGERVNMLGGVTLSGDDFDMGDNDAAAKAADNNDDDLIMEDLFRNALDGNLPGLDNYSTAGAAGEAGEHMIKLPPQPKVRNVVGSAQEESDNELFEQAVVTAGQELQTPAEKNQMKGMMKTGMAVSTDAVGLHVGDFESWNEKQVVLWVKMHLKKNGLSDNVVDKFVAEFATMCVSGKILKQCRSSPVWMNNLKAGFSPENQAFGIWTILSSAVQNIE